MGDWNEKETSSRNGESKAEAQPEPVDTFDSDDDNDNDYEDEEYDEDDDEIEDVSFWRQHFFAICIAFVASVVLHFNNQASAGGGAGSTTSMLPNFSLLGLFGKSLDKHDNLKGFSRTANVSFCQQEIQPAPSKRLYSMDFYIPREHFESVQALYVADQTEDDSYSDIDSIVSSGSTAKGLEDNVEFQCLLEQHRNSPVDRKLKGTTHFYKDPTLEEIYPELAAGGRSGSKARKGKPEQPPLSFTGFATKVVNLSSDPVLLYWDGKGGHENSRKLVGEIPPMQSIGTATMPGHSFHVTPIYDPSTVLKHWVVTPDSALVYYESKDAAQMKALEAEDPKTYAMYQRQMINKAFSRDYMVATGRTWLAQFPRPFPMHHMHEASYIGQEHQVGDMTLRVASVRPKVFTIENFLSAEECKEVIRLGLDQGLTESTLHVSPLAKQNRDTSTRSSSNAWLSRDTSSLTKTIYEKAAELTKIDSNLFRKFHESSAQHHSIAESLQVVRYKKGEEYTPHHDFISPSINDRYQPSRFATLLIYLNDVKEGGETRFPRAVNNFNAEGIEITPKVGSAVLFYSSLEDGNFDDLSQHGGNKVLAGNKWLANLWVRSSSLFRLCCESSILFVSHDRFFVCLPIDLGSRDWIVDAAIVLLTVFRRCNMKW
jgi:prolyl 4-hydroxylase